VSDLLQLAAELVDIPSVSRHEAALCDRVERDLRARPFLQVERTGDTVVARTRFGRARRVLLAGHLDTVPPFGPGGARVEGEALYGLGAVDMKGGLAVLLSLTGELEHAAVDATFVFYACEEIERHADALIDMARRRPEVLSADAAVLGEPTGGVVEAGCQGTLRAVLHVGGRRAHTARPWQGVNAVHRLGPALEVLRRYRPREVVVDGCTYAEQLQAVAVTGGVAGNVVPDAAELTVNFRFAPGRSAEEADKELHRMFAAAVGDGDRWELLDAAAGAPPGLGHPVLESLVRASGAPPRAKVGWTDVATLAAIGVPAANFGPGDPLLAHTADEKVTAGELEGARAVLAQVLHDGALG
jgi:succinyl-diaminopimelate desuccinylase